jgi:beta-lactamase superfamily II metal-dependent hydrolase
MRIGHSQCAVITSPNGQRMMVDCGTRWGDEHFWTPSLQYFRGSAVTNLDEDHLADFGFMIEHCTIPWIASYPSVGAREFALLKRDGMGSGAKAFANWIARPKQINVLYPPPVQPNFGPVRIQWYWNPYAPGRFDTTNNLSLAVFVQYGPFKIAFTGDLEAEGWRGMLRNQSFLQELMTTTVLVASHHGRESGCCTEVFDLLRPEIVILSDDERQYESQETDAWYRARCRGIPHVHNPAERRYVMTTRKDGSMQIDVGPDGRWLLNPVQVRDWPRTPRKPALDGNPFSSPLAGLLR